MTLIICMLMIILSFIILLPTKNTLNCYHNNLSVYSNSINLQNVTYIAFGLLLIYLSGFRPEGIDRDYYGYKNLYIYYSTSLSYTIEPTFIVISKLVKAIFDDKSTALFVIYALIAISIKMYAIKQLSHFWGLSLLIYLSYSFILQDMTQIRAGVAAGFILLTIKPLYEKNIYQFMIVSTLAILFHYSALFVLLFWFMNPQKINVKLYALTIVIVYIINPFAAIYVSDYVNYLPVGLLQNKVLAYEYDNKATLNVYNAWQIMRTMLSFLFLYKINIIHANNKYAILLIKLYVISTCTFVLLAGNPSFAGRMSDLLAISDIIMLPCILYLTKQQFLAKLIVICIAFSFLFLNLFYNKILV